MKYDQRTTHGAFELQRINFTHTHTHTQNVFYINNDC